MKKIYMQPEMRVVKIQRSFRVLVGSDPNAKQQMGSSHQFSRGGNNDDDFEE